MKKLQSVGIVFAANSTMLGRPIGRTNDHFVRKGASNLQKLFFSLFPGGMNGTALLLLRVAVGITSILQCFAILGSPDPYGITGLLCGLGLGVGGLLLVPGLATPIGCLLTFIVNCFVATRWAPLVPSELFGARVTVVLIIVMTADLFLLGPGAYSIDARLFGRREIIIPQHPRASD